MRWLRQARTRPPQPSSTGRARGVTSPDPRGGSRTVGRQSPLCYRRIDFGSLLDDGLDFKLVLVAWAMPGINGVELTSAPGTRRPGMPVVFVTCHYDAWERWVLTKPSRTCGLIGTLRCPRGGKGWRGGSMPDLQGHLN